MKCPSVSLQQITKENYIEVLKLQVDDHQKRFVAPNSWSVAQWHFNPQFFPWAICAGEQFVGFLMYEFEEEANEQGELDCWFFRFMIDKRFQGRGYGRRAFELFLEKVAAEPAERFQRVVLSIEPSNEKAASFYESFGFLTEGKMIDKELVFTKSRASLQLPPQK